MQSKNNPPKKIVVSTAIPVQTSEKNLADKKKWKGIINFQILTFRRTLPAALEYHFKNFKKLEEKGTPVQDIARGHSDKEWSEIKEARENIRFEVQAYISQLRRARYFTRSLDLIPPHDPELKEVWDLIRDREGVIHLLSDKWAAHRSIDYKDGEDESLHMELLLSLEGGATSWKDNHLVLLVSNFSFDLCDFHPKVMKFLDWLFSETDKLMELK